MKLTNKKKCITMCIVCILLISSAIIFTDEINGILRVEKTRTTEYVDNPRSLVEWQKINPNIVMVLEFSSSGKLHNIPVLEVNDGDKYMNRNPWGTYDSMGSVFMETNISPFEQSNNWLINGHSSLTKDWNLSFLKNYVKPKYFESNATFQVELKDGFHLYRIVSFAEYDLDQVEDSVYMGWYQNNFTVDEATSMFNLTSQYILQKTSNYIYTGKQMLTLITCNMNKKDSRYVLMAVEIR